MNLNLVICIAILVAIAYFLFRWFQMPKAGTKRLAMTVWAAFGPYDTAEDAEGFLYRACRAVFGKNGLSTHEKWIQGHIDNFKEWDATGDFLRAQKIQRTGLMLTAYGKTFKAALNAVKAEATLSSSVPDPKLLGDFLVYQLCTNKFNIGSKLDNFVKELPENLQEVTESWIVIYLSWLYKTYAATKHGDLFTKKMLQQVCERLNRSESLNKEGNFWKTFEFWFDKIDNATSMIGTEIKGTEVPFEVFVAMSFMASDAGSPYYKQKDFQDNEFDVATALAVAKDEAMTFIQNTIDLTVHPELQNTNGDISWSDNPACFERHLQRKCENSLFPPDKRDITQREVDLARQKDQQDATELQEKYEKLLHIVVALPDESDWKQSSNIREKIDTLLERAAEIGGELGDAVSTSLHELRKGLVDSQKTALADNKDALDLLHKAEQFHKSGVAIYNNVFVAQKGREDTPITNEDVIPALLSESPDTIHTVMEILDGDVRNVIRQGCIQFLNEAKAGGTSIPQLDEKLNALGSK